MTLKKNRDVCIQSDIVSFFHFLGSNSSLMIPSGFPSTLSSREEFIHKIPRLKKTQKFSQRLVLGSPMCTNMQPCESPSLASREQQSTGKGGYYFSWESSRALGWDWLIQTRWVATHRCDKNRNTLQTFQARSSHGQEVGCGLCCPLIYLLMCSPIKEC